MRDRARAAAAILKSEAYRGAYRNREAPPAGATRAPPRPRGENGASGWPRVDSGASPALAVLALLGLLDLLKGG